MKTNTQVWTDKDLKIAKQMFKKDSPYDDIAKALGRTAEAVRKMLNRQGLLRHVHRTDRTIRATIRKQGHLPLKTIAEKNSVPVYIVKNVLYK